ncbi:MAG: YitT family protein, partial [Oscillospiraceae bacterium]|nr:YitT family protein [Oscillospiraceae bacterium]
IRTAIVTVLVSVMIDVSAPYIPAFEGDMVLTAAFGGVLSGAGIGMIYLRGATTGGSELVARLIGQKLRHFSIGRLILIVDALVVVSAAVVYKQVESALYSIVLLYLSTSVMDGLVYGSYKGRMLLIITKREADVTAGILEKIGRGVTKLKAQGAYTGAERGVLMCALRPSEVYALRSLVMDIDPEAFIVITASEEIHGEGFQQMRN